MNDDALTFGEWTSVRLLGKGGMSEVWEAVSPRLGARGAVKLYAYSGEGSDVRARFEQEARMLASMRHPRIVGVRDIGVTEGDRPFFVMDLVLNPEGKAQTLADIPEGGVDEDTVARWYDDIREALAHIHARGIVHRDLKLQNVMVGPDGRAVLTDFGIARASASGGVTAGVADPVDTILSIRDGRAPVMGSLGYMAPELEMGCAATERSDWYALGVMVYKLLTGTWCDARTDLASTLETFDPAWSKILPKLLHANPAGRECLSFAETRRELAQAEAVAAETRYLKEKSRGHVARHAARWLALACVLLSAALFVGGVEYRADRRAWRQRLLQAGGGASVPSFDELFAIPSAARAEEATDENGNVTMPSRSAFEASRLDALVLTQPVFSALAGGSVTLEKAISDLEAMAEGLADDAERSPLDGLEFGGTAYMQMGDNESLRRLLLQAIEKLRVRSEE